MNSEQLLTLVAHATGVAYDKLTLSGSRRYGPFAGKTFLGAELKGPSDVDIVVPYDGDPRDLLDGLARMFGKIEKHPNHMDYRKEDGTIVQDWSNLVFKVDRVVVNLIIKQGELASSWRIATDQLDVLSRDDRSVFADKKARVAAFKAARNAYLVGYTAGSERRYEGLEDYIEKAKNSEAEARMFLDEAEDKAAVYAALYYDALQATQRTQRAFWIAVACCAALALVGGVL